MNRRFFLGAAAAASLPMSIAAAKPTMAPLDLVAHLSEELSKAMKAAHPNHSFRVAINHDCHFVLITSDSSTT